MPRVPRRRRAAPAQTEGDGPRARGDAGGWAARRAGGSAATRHVRRRRRPACPWRRGARTGSSRRRPAGPTPPTGATSRSGAAAKGTPACRPLPPRWPPTWQRSPRCSAAVRSTAGSPPSPMPIAPVLCRRPMPIRRRAAPCAPSSARRRRVRTVRRRPPARVSRGWPVPAPATSPACATAPCCCSPPRPVSAGPPWLPSTPSICGSPRMAVTC